MKAHEAFQALYKKKSPKELAEATGLSVSTFHKWSESGESHRMNPLECVSIVTRVSGDLQLVHWLCERAGGRFVSLPKPKRLSAAEMFGLLGAALENLRNLQSSLAVAVE